MLKESVTHDNVIYTINEEKKIAEVVGYKPGVDIIRIPHSINHETKEYDVTIISNLAFKESKIRFIIFPEHLKIEIIGEESFHYSSLESIEIPSSVTFIGKHVFSLCWNLHTISIPEDSRLQIIDDLAFTNDPIETIRIPSRLIQIGKSSFSYCLRLKQIEIANDSKLQMIGKSAFEKTLIEYLEIPSKVSQLEDGWCNSTLNLKKIKVSPFNQYYKSYFKNKMIIGKSRFESDYFDCLVFCNRNIKTVTVPSSIERICSYAFDNCKQLCQIIFENDSKLQIIDEYAFHNSSIDSISIPSEVKQIGKKSFAFCKNLHLIEFANDSKLQIIDEGAFYDSSIRSISIPSEVATINHDAFQYCKNLQIFEINDDSKLEYIKYSLLVYCNDIILMIPAHLNELLDISFHIPFLAKFGRF